MKASTKQLWRKILIGELTPLRLVKSVVFIYGTLALAAIFGTDHLLFLPHEPSYPRDATLVMLPTPGGAPIATRWFPGPEGAPVILLSHGNAEDLGDLAPFCEALVGLGFAVLAYDYEGYGQSGGTPSEARLYADIDAAYTHLTTTLRVPAGRIIAYGRSLGGGPSVELATQRPLGGLALESTFTSVQRVAVRYPLFPGDQLKNIDKIGRVGCPVLVMHGKADALIPLRHGEALFAAAPEPKRSLWVEGGGHADLLLTGEAAYGRALLDLSALLTMGDATDVTR